MPRNTTKKTPSKRRLSAAEMTAIQQLLSGSSVTAAAEAAGVDRTTLHRWMRRKVHFREALTRAQEELEATFALRLAAINDIAIDRLKIGVSVDDSKTALAFLEKSGVLRARRSEVAEGPDTTAN